MSLNPKIVKINKVRVKMGDRKEQLEKLRKRYPDTKQISSDCFSVPFPQNSVQEKIYSLRILLKVNFPESRPLVQLFPKLHNRIFLDSHGFLIPKHFEPLNGWTPSSYLHDLVHELIAFISSHYFLQIHTDFDSISNAKFSHSNSSKLNFFSSLHETNYPTHSSTQNQLGKLSLTDSDSIFDNELFNECENLSNEDIKSLLSDEIKFERFYQSRCVVKQLQNELDQFKQTTVLLARHNLELMHSIEFYQQEVSEKQAMLKQQEREDEKDTQNTQSGEQNVRTEKTKCISVQTLQGLLNDTIIEIDQRNETLGNKFLEGKIDMNEFITEFQRDREAYHRLAIKKEQLDLYINRDTN